MLPLRRDCCRDGPDVASHGGDLPVDSRDFVRGISFFLLCEEFCPSGGTLSGVEDCQSAVEGNQAVDVVSWDFAPWLVGSGSEIEGVRVFS